MTSVVKVKGIFSRVIDNPAFPSYQRTLFICAVVILSWKLLWMVPWKDEYLFVWIGWQISKGKLLYKDIFEILPPGTGGLISGVILTIRTITGEDLPIGLWPVLRGLNLVLWILSLSMLESILCRLYQRTYWVWLLRLFFVSFLLCRPISFLLINHHTYSAFFSTLSFWLAIRGISTQQSLEKTKFFWYCCGLAAGITSLFTQTLGTLSLIALCLSLLRIKQPKVILNLIVGFSFPWILTLCYFISQNAFQSFWIHVFVFPLTSNYKNLFSILHQPLFWDVPLYNEVQNFYQNTLTTSITSNLLWLSKLLHFMIRGCLLLLGSSIALLGILNWTPKIVDNPQKSSIWFFSCFSGITFFIASLSCPSLFLFGFHSGWLGLLSIIIFATISERKTIFSPLYKSIAALFSLIFLSQITFVLIPEVTTLPSILSMYSNKTNIIKPRKLFNFDPHFEKAYDTIELIDDYLVKQSQHKPITLFCYNYCPIFYLTLQAKNPTSFTYFIPVLLPRNEELYLLKQLKMNPPEWVIWDHHNESMANSKLYMYPKKDFEMSTEFQNWVNLNYVAAFDLKPFIVYHLK
ncbi:MAG: hypothetical protein K2X01_12020 [Cyanobacteria bacterium]|nr:hypothetical protein [Cyanobacteriota bacterium]